MRRKALVWKLFPIYFVIALASVLIVSIYALIAQVDFYHSQIELDLEIRANLIREQFIDSKLPLQQGDELQRL